MIRELFADNLPGFKNLRFGPGLNIVLADKTETSTEGQSRNGAGKSSIIELVHFLTGGDSPTNSIFRLDQLKDVSFGMSFDLGSDRVVARRSGSSFGQTRINGLTGFEALIDPSGSVSTANWRRILGSVWFKLPADTESRQTFGPSFRSMFSYFARREDSGGFADPCLHTEKQGKADQQVNLSYLFDLDWSISQRWQRVREREKTLKELRKAASSGILGETIGTVARLRTELVVAQRAVSGLEERLRHFQVVEEYKEFEIEASQLTREIAGLVDANTSDRQLLATLKEAMRSEVPPSTTDLRRLYEEAGVTLPDVALQRFEDVAKFHESVVHNRQQYLESQSIEAEGRLAQREKEVSRADTRRAEVMRILSAGGALAHFTELQLELSRLSAKSEAVKQRFEAAQQLEATKASLDAERSSLHLDLQRDFSERENILTHAVGIFERLSSQLYDEQIGSLDIGSGDQDGPQFDVRVHAERSKGIRQVQAFCFDMTLMEIAVERGFGPGFLIHDSHLFDGVDSRQVGRALHLGAILAKSKGFQYIVTMNSDALPTELPAGFDPKEFVVGVKLTDAGEEGGLFGFRFQ